MDVPPDPSINTFLTTGLGGALFFRGRVSIFFVSGPVILDLHASKNVSKRNSVSVGPQCASGWNCAEKYGLEVCTTPSFEPSLALVNNALKFEGRVSEATSKPWFWGVM